MTKDKALKLALETLEYAGPSWIDARQPAITAIKKALANEALDKMAENARELGLDYEPPQRTWVTTTWRGLTDEEIDGMVEITDLSGAYYYDDLLALAQAIEAKLKEKNT